MGILKVVERDAGLGGISYPDLQEKYSRMNLVWDNGESYLLSILVEGGYLSNIEERSVGPDILQLTWAGHDLLDSLRAEFE
jgi:hypothetical protein